jgi:hypothetical protein
MISPLPNGGISPMPMLKKSSDSEFVQSQTNDLALMNLSNFDGKDLSSLKNLSFDQLLPQGMTHHA